MLSVAGERHSVPPGPHRRHHGAGEEVPGGEPLPGGPDRGQGQGLSGQVSGWAGHRMCESANSNRYIKNERGGVASSYCSVSPCWFITCIEGGGAGLLRSGKCSSVPLVRLIK